jgi:hypothetical protein
MSQAPTGSGPARAQKSLYQDVRSLVVSLPQGEQAVIEAVERLSHSRRALAPLSLTIGAFAMLFEGLRLLASNWKLMLVVLLPAAWIWLAMWDIRARLVHGQSSHTLNGGWLVVAAVAVTLTTAASFYLNGAFGFAVADEPTDVRRGFDGARSHRWDLLIPGIVVGILLAFAALWAPDLPKPWYILSMGAAVGLMMLGYVAVPARVIGVRRSYKRSDKWLMTAIGSTVAAIVMFPVYILGRVALLLIGSEVLRPFGVVLFAAAIVLELGATGAVRAVKLGSALAGGERQAQGPAGD